MPTFVLLLLDSYELLVESADNGVGIRFTVAYHFENAVRSAGDRCHPNRMKRLAQEAATLMTSLPLSNSSSVFTRCDTDRLDIMKVMFHITVYMFDILSRKKKYLGSL